MVLKWGARAMSQLPDEKATVEFASGQNLAPGLYGFPEAPANFDDLPAEEKERVEKDINERYKAGPNGFLIIGPTGQDMMGPVQLGGEVASNIAGALIAAWIVALLGQRSFATRWLTVVLIGVFGWLSISASHYLWYRFPGAFVRDELLAAVLEWSVAGLVIAAIVGSCGMCSKAVHKIESGDQAEAGKSPVTAK